MRRIGKREHGHRGRSTCESQYDPRTNPERYGGSGPRLCPGPPCGRREQGKWERSQSVRSQLKPRIDRHKFERTSNTSEHWRTLTLVGTTVTRRWMRCCLCRVLLLCLYLVCLACMSSDMNVPAVRRHARIANALFAFSYLPLSLDMAIGLYDSLLATSAVSSELKICSWTDLGSLCTYLAPDFPTPPRPPTDCIGIRSGHDEWTDDHHYRCSFAFCVLVGLSRFRCCCYLKEPSPNYRLPVSPRVLRRQTGVVTCSHWATLTNSHIWRLSSSFCPLHGSRTGPAAHQEFCLSLPLGSGIATVALSQLSNAIRVAAPSYDSQTTGSSLIYMTPPGRLVLVAIERPLALVECFLFQATDLRCPAALLEQLTHGATHPKSLQMVPIS